MTEKSPVQHFLFEVLKQSSNITPYMAERIAVQFDSLRDFADADIDDLKISGRRKQDCLSPKVCSMIKQIQSKIELDGDLVENWIKFTSRHMTNKIIENIKNLTLDKMNINPFLTRMLHFKTPEELLRFNIYQTLSRSIVTSMGTALEYMIADCGGETSRRGNRKEWYDVVKTNGDDTYWLQIKSGPNNIDADQMRLFNQKFNKTMEEPNQYPKLGIVYGRYDSNSISLTLAKKYLDDYESRLLVGRELWEFISGEEGYHKRVLCWIDESVENELKKESIDDMIQKKIKEITSEFKKRYPSHDSITKYIEDVI